MSRKFIVPILTLAFVAGRSHAQGDDPDLVKALALQRTFQKIIQQNEASIACILVSRSEGYQDVGQGPDKNVPGRLGAFDPALLSGRVSEEKRPRYLKLLNFADPAYVPRSFGSGVVIDANGLILTNYHVVQDATKVFVRLPGGASSYADIHAADPRSDLAVLKLLNRDILPLKAITLGDADKLERGQFVLTLSNPFAAGFRDGQPSASWGILSNIRRRAVRHFKEEELVKPFQFYSTLLQTDARLNLGCSGGALLNLSGEMVGLITSIAAIQGGETPGGFAVPVHAGMRRVIEVLKRGEEVDYAFLGVGFKERKTDHKTGVTLGYVAAGSPASVDGKLKPQDVLLAVNGSPINDTDDVFTTIGMHLAGTKVRLRVQSGAEQRIVDVTLAKLAVPGKRIASSIANRPFFRGLRVDYASLGAQGPLPQYRDIPSGVLVTEVQPNSAADRANLKVGDVITHLRGMPTLNPASFYRSAADARGVLELTLHQPGAGPTKVLLK